MSESTAVLSKLIKGLQAEVTTLRRRIATLEAARPEPPVAALHDRFLWELRYRGAMSVDNVLIETVTDREEEAVELGTRYLDSLATPSVRFVRVRRIVVDRTIDHDAMLMRWQALGLREPDAVVEGEEMAPPEPQASIPHDGRIPPPPPMKPAKPNGKTPTSTPPRAATARRPAPAPVAPAIEPPPVAEGPRHQTHDRDVRAEARQAIADATRTGRTAGARIGE